MSWEEYKKKRKVQTNKTNANTPISSWEKYKQERQQKVSNVSNIENKKTTSKNFLDSVGHTTKSLGAGILGGISGIFEAGTTEVANNIKKGYEEKNKGLLGQLSDLFNATSYIANPTKTIVDMPINIIKEEIEKATNKNDADRNDTALEKGIKAVNNATTQAMNIIPGKKLTDEVTQAIGAIFPEETNKKVIEFSNTVTKPYYDLQQKLNEESQEYNGATQVAGEVANVVGRMIPSIATSILTKNPQTGMAVMAVGAKGTATTEALNKGAELDEAVKTGNTKAMIEYGTELLTGGINVFGKGALDDIIQKGIDKKVKNQVLNYLAQKGAGIGGEVLEETISDILGTLVDKGTVNPEATYSFKDWGETAPVTILSTIVINALTGGYGSSSFKTNTERMQQNQNEPIQDIAPYQQIDNNIANNEQTLYNNNESESVINGEIKPRYTINEGTQEADMGGNISESELFQKRKQLSEQNYREWEQSIKPKQEIELTNEERQLKYEIENSENKKVIFIKEDNQNGYDAGASLDNPDTIYINTEKAKKFGLKRTSLHETMESNIRFADQSTQDIITSTILEIIEDDTFNNQKIEFWKNQKGEIPSDTAIAKDIICDRYAELKGEKLDYKNVLSDEINNRIDMSIEYFKQELENDSSFNLQKKSTSESDIAPIAPNNELGENIAPVGEQQSENTIENNKNTSSNKIKMRNWAKTSTHSETIKGKIQLSDLETDKIQYVPITNTDSLEKANSKISSLGYEEALAFFNSKMGSGEMLKAEDVTLGQRLMQEALQRGDKTTAIELLQDITILGTELGQATQSLSIIQRMTPAGQLRMLEKVISRNQLQEDKAFKGIKLTDDMKNRIMDCYNEDGQTYDQDKLNEVMEQIKQEIADKMPVTKMEKINAWRYLSMLGNPKTHIRNLVSNVAMKGTLAVKNAVARTIETIAPIENRTKTWRKASEEVENFTNETTLEMKDIISGNGKYSNESDIKSRRNIFKNRVLNKLYNLNSNLLEKEDWWFSKSAFKNSFKEFLTANGIKTQEDITNNQELIEKGKKYAIEQAQIATFRQYAWLANKIGDIENKNVATNIAVGSILPFKKTPVNIAKAGLNYSPLGFTKTLTYDIAQVKKGKMEASTLIDHIAQNTTGTVLTLVGYMLAQMGILNGGGDDDKEGKYDYYLGKQAYSLNIGGETYSLSWLSPVAMPLMVGANAYEQLVEGEDWNPDVVMETLAQTLDPLSEMSFLSSLDDVLSSYDSGVQKFAGIAETALQNYVTQFIPTASSQIASTIDDTKRSTKVSGDSDMKMLEELYNKLIYKIPVLRQTLEPSTDIWGNEVKQNENPLVRAFENFISPYSRKENIATEIDAELKELFNQTGDNGLIPNIPYNYLNYKNEKYNMSAEEYTNYKKTYGQTANSLLEDLFKNSSYKTSTMEEKVDMVNAVYDYARDKANKNYLSKEGVSYTNATKNGKDYYKENYIKGAIKNDMTLEEYKLYSDDPEEYKFLEGKDNSYKRKYFEVQKSLSNIETEFNTNKDNIAIEDMNEEEYDNAIEEISNEKKKNIVDNIINSGLQDSEKASLYKKYYNSDTTDTIVKSGINIDKYLTYTTKEFKADYNSNGKAISNSRKNKVISYVNSLKGLNIPQRAILIKSTNTFKFNDYNNDIIKYVKGLKIEYPEKVKILEDLDMTVEEDGTVTWKK